MARPRKQKEETELVKLVRSEDYPEPRSADVHKDEVEGWLKADKGWEIANDNDR